MSEAMKYKLPPLPKPDTHCFDEDTGKDVWSHSPEQMQAYAIAAIEAQGVPDGWRDEVIAIERIASTAMYQNAKDQRNILEDIAERLSAMLASAPPAPQALTTCNCRWDGETQVQQCTLHEAHVDAIHEWAERAKTAEAKLLAPQASVVQQEPLGFISPKQVERIVDPDGEFGAYIPMRKTPAGNFTLAVYTNPAKQAKPQPLSDEQIAAIFDPRNGAMQGLDEVARRFARSIEAAHGITME